MALGLGTIRARDFLIGLAAVLLGCSAVAGVYFVRAETIRADAVAAADRTIAQLGDEAGDLFQPALDLVGTISDAFLMRLVRDEALRTFQALAQGPVQRTDQISSAYIGFESGEFWQHRKVRPDFLQNRMDAGHAEARGYRRTILETAAPAATGSRRSTWYFFSEPRQNWSAVAEPDFDFDPRMRPWFRTADGADRPTWTAPYRTASSDDYALTLVHGLKGLDGRVWGVAAVDFLIAPLGKTLARLRDGRLPPGSYLRIVDAAGTAMVQPPGGGGVRDLGVLSKNGKAEAETVAIDGRRHYVGAVALRASLGLPMALEVAIPVDALTEKELGELRLNLAILGSLLLVLAVIALSSIRGRRAARDIGTMDRLTRRIAAGELDIEIVGTERRDAVGGLSRSVEVLRRNSIVQRADQEKEKALARQLAETAMRIAESVEAIRAAATEISQGSDDLAARTERQATALQEAVSTMADISATVAANARKSDDARKLAADALARAESGDRAVSSVVGAMSEIEGSSARIGKIVQVMEEIAFQTKMLALNAAVEAARAGEAGRGFAIVAQEVRQLADRSRDAAQQIRTQIAHSSRDVGQGVHLAGAAGAALGSIIDIVRQLAAIAPEIATGSREQSVSIAEINRVIGDLDAATQQNAALVEQSSASASSLAAQATNLVAAVSSFRGHAARGKS
jgi:methyl-accepting chemotaxis protein